MIPLKPDVQDLLHVNKIRHGGVLNQFSMQRLKAWRAKFGLGQVINLAMATTAATPSVGLALRVFGKIQM